VSYCRWSSGFGECDVYVYADVRGGWTTHVASRRLKHRVPDEIRALASDESVEIGERFVAAHKAETAWRESLPCDEVPCTTLDPVTKETKPGVYRTPKDSEYLDLREVSSLAGRSFNDETPGECADRLESLRAAGFNVPQYAIDELREESGALAAEVAK
jgi:hypothetical protein